MKRKILVQRIPGLFTTLYEKALAMAGETYYPRIAREIPVHIGEGLILDPGRGPGHRPVAIARQNPSIKVGGIDLSRASVLRRGLPLHGGEYLTNQLMELIGLGQIIEGPGFQTFMGGLLGTVPGQHDDGHLRVHDF